MRACALAQQHCHSIAFLYSLLSYVVQSDCNRPNTPSLQGLPGCWSLPTIHTTDRKTNAELWVAIHQPGIVGLGCIVVCNVHGNRVGVTSSNRLIKASSSLAAPCHLIYCPINTCEHKSMHYRRHGVYVYDFISFAITSHYRCR